MVIVVCFVGGMLYYSMNVLWPRQSQAFFIPEGATVMRGVYAIIFSCGTWRMFPPFPPLTRLTDPLLTVADFPSRLTVAGLITCFICSRLHHEKWQLVGFTVVQTALIGSMASVTAESKTQAIITVVLAATTITPPQLLSFTMLSFGLDDQTDL